MTSFFGKTPTSSQFPISWTNFHQKTKLSYTCFQLTSNNLTCFDPGSPLHLKTFVSSSSPKSVQPASMLPTIGCSSKFHTRNRPETWYWSYWQIRSNLLSTHKIFAVDSYDSIVITLGTNDPNKPKFKTCDQQNSYTMVWSFILQADQVVTIDLTERCDRADYTVFKHELCDVRKWNPN